MPFRTDHPRHRPFQSFEEHQAEMATWLGTTVDEMNRSHDRWHVSLAKWLGATSHALRMAAGAPLSREEAELAGLEEDAVLSVQRYARRAGVEVPVITERD